jgi:hypothetical protein
MDRVETKKKKARYSINQYYTRINRMAFFSSIYVMILIKSKTMYTEKRIDNHPNYNGFPFQHELPL